MSACLLTCLPALNSSQGTSTIHLLFIFLEAMDTMITYTVGMNGTYHLTFRPDSHFLKDWSIPCPCAIKMRGKASNACMHVPEKIDHFLAESENPKGTLRRQGFTLAALGSWQGHSVCGREKKNKSHRQLIGQKKIK